MPLCRFLYADYRGEFVYNAGKPDGTPRTVMDVSKLTALGWQAQTQLEAGFERAYRWYVEHVVGEVGRGG